jgi:hypothetical protein
MKTFYLLFFSLFIISTPMDAQSSKNIAGEYYLHGVMETASGFKLNADSTFEFFFSYGALDRSGFGEWTLQNNTIILNSKPYPGKDFKLVNSDKKESSFTTVKIEESNTNLFSLVHCIAKTKDGDSLFDANSDGIISLPGGTDTIHLVSELCSERISSFAINRNEANYFIFHFEPWIVQVFFKDFLLEFVNGHLEGKHPLLGDKIFEYVK